MRYFSEHQGNVFAILNCKQRRKKDDAMLTMALDTRELIRYRAMKEAGNADSTIFRTLFPPRVEATNSRTCIKVEIGELNKRQLVHLITQELGESLNSLPKLAIADLRKMLLALRSRKR